MSGVHIGESTMQMILIQRVGNFSEKDVEFKLKVVTQVLGISTHNKYIKFKSVLKRSIIIRSLIHICLLLVAKIDLAACWIYSFHRSIRGDLRSREVPGIERSSIAQWWRLFSTAKLSDCLVKGGRKGSPAKTDRAPQQSIRARGHALNNLNLYVYIFEP